MKKTEVPKHLSDEAQALFSTLTKEHLLKDFGRLKILRVACESFDRAQSAREAIDRDGMSIKDKFGQIKPHPLIACERDSRAAFLSGLKALGLDFAAAPVVRKKKSEFFDD